MLSTWSEKLKYPSYRFLLNLKKTVIFCKSGVRQWGPLMLKFQKPKIWVDLTSSPPLAAGKYHTALGSVYSTKIRHSPKGKKLPHLSKHFLLNNEPVLYLQDYHYKKGVIWIKKVLKILDWSQKFFDGYFFKKMEVIFSCLIIILGHFWSIGKSCFHFLSFVNFLSSYSVINYNL